MYWERIAADTLNWTPGCPGKGNIYRDGSISTWCVDGDQPNHQERADYESKPPAFLFYIDPDGGIHHGGLGYNNQSPDSDQNMLARALAADHRFFLAPQDSPSTLPYEDFGHARNVVDALGRFASPLAPFSNPQVEMQASHENPAMELKKWLDGLANSTQLDSENSQLTPHHRDELDMVPNTMEPASQGDALDPPGHPYEPSNWYQSRYHESMGSTLPQEQREWANLSGADEGAWDDDADVVHTFPDGWTVQQPKNAWAAAAIGKMMRNCWQSYEKEAAHPYGDWNRDMRDKNVPHSLHDPQGIPRVAFFVRGNGEKTPFIYQPLGPRNHYINDHLHDRLGQFAGQIGAALSPIDSYVEQAGDFVDPELGKQSTQVIEPDGDPAPCHNCGSETVHDPCDHCGENPERPPVTDKGSDFQQMERAWYDQAWDEPGSAQPWPPEPMHWRHDHSTDVALAKVAANGEFYHVAPAEHRESIQQHGLLPSDKAPTSPWMDNPGVGQPPGVYFFDSPNNARMYAHLLQQKQGDVDDEDAYEYNALGDLVPRQDSGYDVWKVNAKGLPVSIDPESSLVSGQLSADEAQQEINEQVGNWGRPDMTEGHRWFLPHVVDPGRLTHHEHIPLHQLGEDDYHNDLDATRLIPQPWTQVPIEGWNEDARQRYLGTKKKRKKRDNGSGANPDSWAPVTHGDDDGDEGDSEGDGGDSGGSL